MKIALLKPNDAYGISIQTQNLADALQELPDTEVEIFSLAVGRQPTAYYIELGAKLNAPEIDVIHLSHEYSFYGGVLPKESGFWDLRYLLKKPVVLTAYNLAPMEMLLAVFNKSMAQRLKDAVHFRTKATRDAVEIAPFATAYTIVSTNNERKILIERGAKPEYVTVIPDGIPIQSDLFPDQCAELTAEFMDKDCFIPPVFTWRNRAALAYALAAGYPILVSTTPETQEIWSRRECLELYNGNNDREFERKCTELTANKERQTALSVQARRYAERYPFSRIAVLTRRAYVAAISVF